MHSRSISKKWFTGLLTCASVAVLLTATSPAEAVYLSSTVHAWKTGPINVSGANGAQYCSMKAGFDNGTTLVWARDQADQNSLAIDFDEAALQRGQEYYVALDVQGGEYREYLAKAVSDRVLIMQLGDDAAFFTSLQHQNALNIDMDGVALSYSLKGSGSALKNLDKCVAKISGKDVLKTANSGRVQFEPKTPKNAENKDNAENKKLRAELARLKSEKEALESAQNALIAEKDALAAAQANAAMKAEQAALDIATQKALTAKAEQAAIDAQKLQEEAVQTAAAEPIMDEMITPLADIEMASETDMQENDVEMMAEVAVQDDTSALAETIEETTDQEDVAAISDEELKIQNTIEKSREIAALVRQIERLRVEKENLSAMQFQAEEKLADMDQVNAEQTALLAEVERLRATNEVLQSETASLKTVEIENQALSLALSAKEKEISTLSEQVAEVNVEGREISVLKSEMEILRGRLAVFENKKPITAECSVGKLPSQLRENNSALKDVILAAELATDADLIEHKDVKRPSFSWRTGAVSGHAEQYVWPIHKDFKSMAEDYVAREKTTCDGAFSRSFGTPDLVSGIQVMEAELTCVTEQGPYASVLFFYGGHNEFTVLEQEAQAKEMRTAIENRKRIFDVVLPRVTN